MTMTHFWLLLVNCYTIEIAITVFRRFSFHEILEGCVDGVTTSANDWFFFSKILIFI